MTKTKWWSPNKIFFVGPTNFGWWVMNFGSYHSKHTASKQPLNISTCWLVQLWVETFFTLCNLSLYVAHSQLHNLASCEIECRNYCVWQTRSHLHLRETFKISFISEKKKKKKKEKKVYSFQKLHYSSFQRFLTDLTFLGSQIDPINLSKV